MGRDLLYKPQTVILPDEEEDEKAVKKSDKAAKHQAKQAREVGRSLGVDPRIQKQLDAKLQKGARGPAFKNDYFNKDVSNVGQTNQSTNSMKALRGSEGAADLRNIVLPALEGEGCAGATELRSAGEMMGLEGDASTSLEGLLQREGDWAQNPKNSLEALKSRFEEMERMVQTRKEALAKMRDKPKGDLHSANPTMRQADVSEDLALGDFGDLVGEANTLISAVEGQSVNMHDRLKKTLGIKKK